MARAVCERLAAGEPLSSICADADMPCQFSIERWAKRWPKFGHAVAQARTLGELKPDGRPSSYDPATARRVLMRLAEGESLLSISRDPAMPCVKTILHWGRSRAEFGDELDAVREAAAERMSDWSMDLAMAATTATAYLTSVRLAHMRWRAALLSPGTHGRTKPVDPPARAEVLNVTMRNFQIEVDPETGRIRSVAYHHDPERGEIVRDLVGEWKDPDFPLVRQVDYLEAKRLRLEHGMDVDNPNAWDRRPSAKDAPEA
jgi:hypothetical protein